MPRFLSAFVKSGMHRARTAYTLYRGCCAVRAPHPKRNDCNGEVGAVPQRLAGICCLLSGFVLLIAALHERLRIRMLRETAVFTGRVVALRCRRESRAPHAPYHEATVSYAVDGREYRSILRILPGEVLPLPGTGIRLSCYPWQPERLRPVPMPPRRVLLRACLFGCALFLAAGIALCLPL